MRKKALITGITGQDGSYLAELLLEKGYEVHGLVWPPVEVERSWLAPVKTLLGSRLLLRTADMREPDVLPSLLRERRPSEVYHLAGQTHVVDSFNDPEGALNLNAMAAIRLLQAARNFVPQAKIFHASSSEIFGAPMHSPQDEETPLRPLNPYACAKAFASQMVGVYRRTYGMFASNGILYAHESPRRGEHFVTRRVCQAAAAIKLGRQQELRLGDLAALRDWTDAREVVRGMWLALQHSSPEDFVFASGELHSVQELVEAAFGEVGLDWKQHVCPDLQYQRPVDTRRMVGNASKAKRLLGWAPQTPFTSLVREMVQAELERLERAG
jgi:GDPmannose 4,6-dehydratase